MCCVGTMLLFPGSTDTSYSLRHTRRGARAGAHGLNAVSASLKSSNTAMQRHHSEASPRGGNSGNVTQYGKQRRQMKVMTTVAEVRSQRENRGGSDADTMLSRCVSTGTIASCRYGHPWAFHDVYHMERKLIVYQTCAMFMYKRIWRC